MKDLAPIIGLFALVLIFGAATAGTGGVFSDYLAATSTDESFTEPELVYEDSERAAVRPEPVERLSEVEIEERIARLYEDVSEYREAQEWERLREPVSPYRGKVELWIGNARETSWSREYVTVHADPELRERIDITGWTLESYVTGERAVIPMGDRTIEREGTPVAERIVLLPGDDAYLITGRSPIKTSFHENLCTGYLEEDEDFYPSLDRACAYPEDELEAYTMVSVTDDACYDFVRGIGSCELTEQDDLTDELHDRGIRLTSACRYFIVNELTYDRCVARHGSELLFDNVGSWYIYLGRTRDLWRQEREVIRLLDANGKVVDVVEY